MIDTQLVRRGVCDDRVLDAMRNVPREQFVSAGLASRAYEDAALPVDCGQTISQPYMVARMTELLEPALDGCVLEIGTGTGYQTAVLARLFGQVYTMEWHVELTAAAQRRLRLLGLANVTYCEGDGSLGWPAHAPFDAIIVTAGAPRIPQVLRDQLTVGGCMVVPVGPVQRQSLLRVRRSATGFTEEKLLECRFVKLLGEEGWPE